MYTTYILYSPSINQFYTGQTVNLENRMLEHNKGETTSIKKGIPWELVWHKQFNSRREAMHWEKKIKARGAKRFLTGV